MSIIKRINKYRKEQGTIRMIMKGIHRIAQFVFSYCPMNYYIIQGKPQNQAKALCAVTIREGKAEDYALIDAMLKDSYKSPDAVIRRQAKDCLNSGADVFLGFCEGKLISVSWLHYWPGSRVVYPEVTIREDELLFGHFEIHPDYRGKRIYSVLLQHHMNHAAEKGVKRCYVRTITKHTVSIKGIEKAGFTFASRNHRFILFGKMFNKKWDSSKVPQD